MGAPIWLLFWLLTLAQQHSRAAAIFVDEFDAGQLKCPSAHGYCLRSHAKPGGYRFFLDALAIWLRTAFAEAGGLDAPAAAERAAVALVRRTPG